MKDKYVPEVDLANDMERSSLRTMYNMRGFVYSFQEDFWLQTASYLKDVEKCLAAAGDLSGRYADLADLKAGVDLAGASVEAYRALADQTNEVIIDIRKQRQRLDLGAAGYLENCNRYLEAQHRSMSAEIAAHASAGKLRERLRKITLINQVIRLYNEVRVANWKAQTYQDPDMIAEVTKDFAEMDRLLAEIRPLTRQAADLEQLDRIVTGGNTYKQALTALLAGYWKLEELSQTRGQAAETVLVAAQQVAESGIGTTQKLADSSALRVGASVVVVIAGLLVALALAVIIAVLLTRMIVGPVKKGVAFAEALAEGDLTAEIAVSQSDEIGTLASAPNRMAGNLRTMVRQINDTARQVAALAADLGQQSGPSARSARPAARSPRGPELRRPPRRRPPMPGEELEGDREQVNEHAQARRPPRRGDRGQHGRRGAVGQADRPGGGQPPPAPTRWARRQGGVRRGRKCGGGRSGNRCSRPQRTEQAMSGKIGERLIQTKI